MAVEGDVYCNECGKYLGNYMIDDFYKFIRLKYCPVCRQKVDRIRKKKWIESRRKKERAKKKRQKELEETYVSELETKVQLTQTENELLKKRIAELRGIKK